MSFFLIFANLNINASFIIDIVDDGLKSGGTDPYNGTSGTSYDIVNGHWWDGYSAGQDGENDVTVSVNQVGFGANVNPNSDETGNSTTYTGAVDVNTTGVRVRSRISSTSGVESNNNGITAANTVANDSYRLITTVDISLADHIIIGSLADFSASSANTSVASSIVWEFSYVQLLDRNGNPFDTFTHNNIPDYLSHVGNEINGHPTGNPTTFIGDDTGTVVGVGTDDVTGGASGPLNALEKLDDSDIAFDPSLIGGFRFVTVIEDTRGITDTSFNYTATINDLDVVLVPEPSIFLYILSSIIFLIIRRKRCN